MRTSEPEPFSERWSPVASTLTPGGWGSFRTYGGTEGHGPHAGMLQATHAWWRWMNICLL